MIKEIFGFDRKFQFPPYDKNRTSFLSYPLVAAIDFGTTYSGWAYSTKDEFKSSPLRIHTRHWQGGDHISIKAPTTILFKPDGFSMDSFGYDAESKYADLSIEREHRNWFFFRRFKMKMYENEDLSLYTTLQDECNKSLPALTVFSAAIRYLKNDLLDTLKKTMKGRITAEDILWVLTVPAIWDDQAKQFMRVSASQADIRDENLLLALEPEAASILCSFLPVQTMYGADFTAILATFQHGSRYMTLDAGGGTIDITIHEVTSTGHLKELCKATGGAWGGTSVDRAFEHFLIGLLGPDVFQRFKNNCTDDYLDFFRSFEVKKRGNLEDSVIMKIPMTLKEKFEEIRGIVLPTFLSSLKFGGTIKGWFSDQDLNVYLVTSKCKTTIAGRSVYEKMFWEELEFQLDKDPCIYFRQFLEELVGVLTYDKFCMEQPEDHQRLVESFKMQMELRSISRAFGVQLSIPDSLTQLYTKVTGKDFDSKLSLKENEGPASLLKDKMKLKPSVMKNLFNYSIQNIVRYISNLLENNDIGNLASIVMVGGFSDCQLLQDTIRSHFPSMRVIIPADAGLSVLKGAVIYGHDSSLITQRICKRTYGVEMLARFINGRHDNSKKVIIDGDELCRDVFDKYVEIGQTVALNECVAVRNYRAAKEEDPYITLMVYTSTSKNPMYVDDVSCAKLGTVQIPITDRSVPLADRCFTVSFVFGNTELKVEAKETRTGQTLEAKLDLLGHH